jgi:cysteine synthase
MNMLRTDSRAQESTREHMRAQGAQLSLAQHSTAQRSTALDSTAHHIRQDNTQAIILLLRYSSVYPW